ncbi:MAG: radical SAM family heme chaperone HemW [Chlamydiia bacterium]
MIERLRARGILIVEFFYMAEEISLYIHLPFCRKKCPYCSFFVLPYSLEAEEMLVEALLRHLEIIEESFRGKRPVSVYFGGGTPSLVSLEGLAKIVGAVRRLPALFDESCEWTLEANPEDIDEGRAKSYSALGINRVSLGVQSFAPEELLFLGRAAGKSQSVKAIEAFHAAGIQNISIDLIFELMDQTVHDFAKTLDVVKELPITHLSLYNLMIEEGSSFYKKKESLEKRRPTSEEGAKMVEKAIEKLNLYGFEHYEISAFCKNGLISRHNTGYWTARPFWGIGPSAWSFIDGERMQCVKNLKKYHEQLHSNSSPFCFTEKLDPIDLHKEELGLRLRLNTGLAKEKIHLKESFTSIKNLIDKGWVEETSSTFFLTKTGKLFYDSVQMELL